MTGWNLPPGCRVSDLPGNSKADEELEALYDSIATLLEAAGLDIDTNRVEKLMDSIAVLAADSYAKGYKEGMYDQSLATERES